MPVTRKPTEDHRPRESLEESPAFQEYLHKGSRAAKAQPEDPKAIRFTLHLPGHLCQQVDQLRQRRPLKISRHQWVLEAIWEKIQREQAPD